MKQTVSVLVTGAGSPGAPGVIRSLRKADDRRVRIVGADMDPDSSGFALVDAWRVVPRADKAGFVSALLALCREERIDVVMPLVTDELPRLAESISEFEAVGTKVLVSAPEGLRIANNKWLLMSACAGQGIPTPVFRRVGSWSEFQEAVYSLGYPGVPVCVKPPVSRGLRGFRILRDDIDRLDLLINHKPNDITTNLEELSGVLRDAQPFPELLIMEYLPGREYTVDVLADRGKALTVVPRLREKMRMGVSFACITDNNPEVIGYSSSIVSLLGLHGNIGLQFKLDESGIPKTIESNPRLQGTTVLCTAAGVNMPYDAVRMAVGEPVVGRQEHVRWGVKVIRYWGEVYAEAGRFYEL